MQITEEIPLATTGDTLWIFVVKILSLRLTRMEAEGVLSCGDESHFRKFGIDLRMLTYSRKII